MLSCIDDADMHSPELLVPSLTIQAEAGQLVAAAQAEMESIQQEAAERLQQLASELRAESCRRANAEARLQHPPSSDSLAQVSAQVCP